MGVEIYLGIFLSLGIFIFGILIGILSSIIELEWLLDLEVLKDILKVSVLSGGFYYIGLLIIYGIYFLSK